MRLTLGIRTRRAFALGGFVLAFATACGGGSSATSSNGSSSSAADFVRRVTTEFARGQAGPLWDSLHPADQAVVSRARYMDCESNEGFGLTKIKVLQTYNETIDIVGKPTASTAVSVKVTADDGITTATMHAVRVNGSWRWVLSPSEYAAYANGKCPAA